MGKLNNRKAFHRMRGKETPKKQRTFEQRMTPRPRASYQRRAEHQVWLSAQPDMVQVLGDFIYNLFHWREVKRDQAESEEKFKNWNTGTIEWVEGPFLYTDAQAEADAELRLNPPRRRRKKVVNTEPLDDEEVSILEDR